MRPASSALLYLRRSEELEGGLTQGPAVRTDSLLERRVFELPVHFCLSDLPMFSFSNIYKGAGYRSATSIAT
jgi:hypothetical protein